MTPVETDAFAKRIETAIENQRVKLQWFLFFLPLIFGLTYGLIYVFLANATRAPSSYP